MATYRITHKEYRTHNNLTMGYLGGLKQPLGAFKRGLSIHQKIKPTIVPEMDHKVVMGIPNYIIWVNENSGECGVQLVSPAEPSERPSGMVAFVPAGFATPVGSILLACGGKRGETIDLYLSKGAYNPHDFQLVGPDFNNFIPSGSDNPSASGVCLHTTDEKVILVWRNGSSIDPKVTVRCRLYDGSNIFGSRPAADKYECVDLGSGESIFGLGNVGIEQVWTRYDKKFNFLFASWQYFVKRRKHGNSTNYYGSCPFLYSDDQGETWKNAKGLCINPSLPLCYSSIHNDSILVPDDHIGQGRGFEVMNSDIGVFGNPGAEHGNFTFWMVLPEGCRNLSGSEECYSPANFWLFDGNRWKSHRISDGEVRAKTYALGTTRDYLVFAYSDNHQQRKLLAKISKDGGRTWSVAFELDTIPTSPSGGDGKPMITWVSFVQPADGYDDNFVRFFYTYSLSDDFTSAAYRNNIKWIKFQIEEC